MSVSLSKAPAAGGVTIAPVSLVRHQEVYVVAYATTGRCVHESTHGTIESAVRALQEALCAPTGAALGAYPQTDLVDGWHDGIVVWYGALVAHWVLQVNA
jgi:hypothetical protein